MHSSVSSRLPRGPSSGKRKIGPALALTRGRGAQLTRKERREPEGREDDEENKDEDGSEGEEGSAERRQNDDAARGEVDDSWRPIEDGMSSHQRSSTPGLQSSFDWDQTPFEGVLPFGLEHTQRDTVPSDTGVFTQNELRLPSAMARLSAQMRAQHQQQAELQQYQGVQFSQAPAVSRDNDTEVSQPSRQKMPVHITISDDRSKGSEFEQSKRILIALGPRGNKQNLSQSPSLNLVGATVRPEDGPAPSTTHTSNHALQDHQMQLMLLEQQKKKRLLKARQEHELVQSANSYGDADGVRLSSLPGSELHETFNNWPVPDSGSFWPSFVPSEAEDMNQNQRTSDSSASFVNPLSVIPQIIGSGTTMTDSTLMPQTNASETQALSDSHSPLQKPLAPRYIEISTLGIPEEATTSLGAIRAYIAHLQRRPKPAIIKPIGSRVQIIHRIIPDPQTPSLRRMYLDHPQWAFGENNSKALSSSLSISNVSAYLQRNQDIAFVVYRDYDLSVLEPTSAKDEDERGTLLPVKHTSETIQPATQVLREAIAGLLTYEAKPIFRDKAIANAEAEGISAPYLAIYHRRKIMKAFLDTLPIHGRSQFQLLLDYVLSQSAEEYAVVDALLQKGCITYSYIKYLYIPGDVLVEDKGSKMRGYLSTSWLQESQSQATSFSKPNAKVENRGISCEYWEFDGSFSRKHQLVRLELKPDEKAELKIEELNVRPLRFLGKAVETVLQRRGEMFWKCRFRHFVSYHEDAGRESHHSGDERFMIDLGMYRELHKRENHGKGHSGEEGFADDLGPELMENDSLPNENFSYLLPLTIKGYSLKRKKWLDLQVDRISEVVWNKDAFESLVLDRKTKKLIRALVSSHLEGEKATDLISGKGNGLILLLHGGPGTGKTLTAESVAEIAEKPLYPVTCGDIGTEPEMVETYLESVLNLGKMWGCVVLLDEADVFLEQRSLEDLQRNALVSIFLRVLEYYDGILILTSNRVGTFDEAFKSRIQLALHYPNLSAFQRTQIWGNFISRLEKLQEKDVDFDDLKDHVEDLAKHKMNGREIRNAITTARQYAKWDKQVLNHELMKDIIETAGRFDVYIEKLNGGYSQDQLAEDEGLRLGKAV